MVEARGMSRSWDVILVLRRQGNPAKASSSGKIGLPDSSVSWLITAMPLHDSE